jgi:hypothetical protein
MASLAENTARVVNGLDNIKKTITNNGCVVLPNTPIESYPELIDNACALNSEQGYNKGFNDGREVGYSEGYNSGVDFGYEHGIQQGIQQGKQAQYDDFWDEAQSNGKRTFYNYFFSGGAWNNKTFKPKYDIVPTSCQRMFEYCPVTRFKAILNECNIKIDLSNMTDVTEMFYYAFMNPNDENIIPDIFHKGITNATNLFYVATGVKTIENFTVAEDCKMNMAFFRTDNLVNLTIGNTIAANGWDFYWSPKLSHDSIINVIEHLSPATTGLSIRFLKRCIDTAFETSEGAADGTTSDEWTNLVASRSNWTIVLG